MRFRTVFMITGIGVHDPPESVFTIDWNLEASVRSRDADDATRFERDLIEAGLN
jgi:hypothetical protein